MGIERNIRERRIKMIKEYKENTTTYIKKCEECNSKFTYQYKDVEKNRFLDVKYSIECPSCYHLQFDHY